MKNKSMLAYPIGGLVFVALICYIAFSGDSGTIKSPRPSMPLPLSPPVINVYIENSGSMYGYVNGGTTDFQQSVYNYLADIKANGLAKKMNLFYINSRIIPQGDEDNLDDFINRLDPDSFNAKGGDHKTTDLSEVYKKILTKASKDTLCIFISDCIFSPGKNKDANQYLVNQQIGIKLSTAEKLQKMQLGIAVYELTSQFNGFYYNHNDVPTMIKGQRPFYIWLAGDIKQIEKIKEFIPDDKFEGSGVIHSFTISPSQFKIDYGILENPKAGDFDRDDDSPSSCITNINKATEGPYAGQFMFTIGCNMRLVRSDFGEEYIMNPSNYALLFDQKSNQDFKIVCITHNNTSKSKFTHNIQISTKKIIKGELNLELQNKLPSWINDISSIDDSNIGNSMNKTYGFKYMIKGIYDAYNLPDTKCYANMKITLK